MLSKDEERTKDLTAANELIQGLTFDQFDENISCRVARGILLGDYPTLVENFMRRFSAPVEVKESLLEAEFVEDMMENLFNFKFKKGKTGRYVYGRVATVKDGDKIDIAYSVYTLDFKLSPSVIQHTRKTKFLWFTTGEVVWQEDKERDLSMKNKDDLQQDFMTKAISKFRSEYAALIDAE